MESDINVSVDISTPTTPSPSDREPVAGPSSPRPLIRLDNIFNFQIVVFQVEDCLFQVLRNGFNVPGTIFEAMFSLPTAETDESLLEGNSLENPILLEGVEASEFRVFLKVLYPFISQSNVSGYDDWISVLNLATMWDFRKIRATAITKLSDFLTQKSPLEKIYVGRKYRAIDWVKDGYAALCSNPPSTLEEFKPSEPFGPPGLDWESIARILYVQNKIRNENLNSNQYCSTCGMHFGPGYGTTTCRNSCRIKTVIEEVFRVEFDLMKDPPEVPDGNTSPVPQTRGMGKKNKKKK